MNIELLSENLKRLMQLHGHLSLSELSRATQIPQPTLHHIFSGVTKRPRRHALQSLASYFGVTIDQLLGNQKLPDMLPNSMQEVLNMCYIPIISQYEAQHWPNYSVREGNSPRQLILDNVSHFHGFAMLLAQSHQELMIPKGSLLIFDADRKASSQDFILIELADHDAIQIRQLVLNSGKQYLIENAESDANLVPVRPYRDRIIATLVESRIRFHNHYPRNGS